MKRFLLLAVVLCCGVLGAAKLPHGTLVFEAESFTVYGDGWWVKKHFPNWYGDRPSGGNFLAGSNKKKAVAVKKISVPTPGKYKLHLRYLDVLNYPGPFQISVKRQGRVLAEKKFDLKSKRLSPEGAKRYGKSFAKFLWDHIAFQLDVPGEIEIVISKLPGKNITGKGSRHLDLFLLTSDLAYQPSIMDVYSLFVKVRMLKDQPHPAAVHVFGRLARSPSYPPHMNINRKGLFIGASKGINGMQKYWLGAGDESPWIEISKYLTFHGRDRLSFDTRRSFKQADESAAFELIFSRTPDEKNIIKRFSRSGRGNGMLVTINLAQNQFSCDLVESRGNLERARAAVPPQGGRAPVKFPFLTGMRVSPKLAATEIIRNEHTVLKLLGISGITGLFVNQPDLERDFPFYTLTSFCFHLKDRCFTRPQLNEIENLMQSNASAAAKLKRLPLFVNLMDEPDFDAAHVVSCAYCKGGFAKYLADNNAGISGAPTLDKGRGALYYWTIRYRNNLVTRFFRTVTEIMQKINPEIRTTANFAPDITGGTSVGRGCDWFEIFNSGALTFGWHEDWANLSGTYQCVGFQNAVMRAACRGKNLPYGIYNILCRTPWEVEAKGFSAIGYGNMAMHFFNYGPHYAITSDTNSQRPEIYSAIKNITYASGKVEETLTAARPVRGELAMLLSRTSDIWNLKSDNIYGKDRVFLHLLLRHCGYSTDVLGEDDLASELNKYKVLFAVDSHIRHSQLKYILDWVKNGNTLYLGANALMFDEFNRPLKWEFPRGKFEKLHKVGRGEDNFVRSSSKNERFKEMPVIGGRQLPFGRSITFGNGRIISGGFFPGLSYMHASRQSNPKIYSVRSYPEAHRRYIAALKLPVLPRVVCSDYLVEAHLLESPDKYLIVLANWSGEPRQVRVSFNGKTYSVNVGGGGFIEVSK